jgi:hypothetical protein
MSCRRYSISGERMLRFSEKAKKRRFLRNQDRPIRRVWAKKKRKYGREGEEKAFFAKRSQWLGRVLGELKIRTQNKAVPPFTVGVLKGVAAHGAAPRRILSCQITVDRRFERLAARKYRHRLNVTAGGVCARGLRFGKT